MLQVEFYFSDVNILKDVFLLKHARRGKQGFVNLKLISSFHRMKSITKDYRVVAYSLRQSDTLIVNEEGTKVRRKDPLPKIDETSSLRTVIAVNLPFENPTVGTVADMFSKCGDIALIRILRPGKPIPPDVKKYSSKHPELGNSVCTVIEFESPEGADKAMKSLHDTANWRSGLRVTLLAAKTDSEKSKKKNKKKEAKNKEKDKENGAISDNCVTGSDVEDKVPKRKNSRVNELSNKNQGYSSGSDIELSDQSPHVSRVRAHSAGNVHNTTRSSLSPNPRSSNRLSPNVSPKSSPRSSPRGSPRGSPTSRRKQHGRSPLAAGLSPSQSPRNSPRASPERRKRNSSGNIHTDSAGERPTSPWVQRRLLLKAQDGSPDGNVCPTGTSPRHSPLMPRRLADGTIQQGALPPRMANLVCVTRQPLGPDGTKGFHIGNGTVSPRCAEANNAANTGGDWIKV